ncbi:TIGR03083 family protein [Thermomonospora echinospora]|uniref:TIGR03083 family protein n=1 Tax=Thermomonospora echinospora TaxID=1992 RepID=A0A1H5VPJ9_9ACTN|nr:maleylpyruvate isomerase family mycothiol-dependent enzyme [Thermomonospora echinospora]SEF89229.1 TIGR03083 family protein [Thermomonospora echinospora]
MRDDMARNAAAWEQTLRSTIALAGDFDASHYDLSTDCPGWTVKDVLSHLISVERMLLGEALPEHPLPDDLPHVRNDFGRLLEIGVDVRRPVPGEQVLAELAEVLDLRLAALPGIDPEQPTTLPTGATGTYALFMEFRAFDCYVHEQDIRRAVNRPGNLDAPAAQCARARLAPGLPYVFAKRAGARPGQSLRLEVTGPAAFTAYIAVAEDGKARETEPVPDPTVTLRMDWESYLKLASGRCTPESVAVTTTGDTTLATRILTNMAVTP